MTSSPHGPYIPGLHTSLQWRLQRVLPTCEGERISKRASQFRLQSATRLHEVGIASNRASEWRGEYVPGPCTHRPSHHGS